uniref:Uncharacterized protein n=1 Tax=Hyaloperonospora arabidopsidis (strain Emoy2) TaxID=559515 RepID=M4BS34_HYAAE
MSLVIFQFTLNGRAQSPPCGGAAEGILPRACCACRHYLRTQKAQGRQAPWTESGNRTTQPQPRPPASTSPKRLTSTKFKLRHSTNAMDQATIKRKSSKALAVMCLAMEDCRRCSVRRLARTMNGHEWKDTTMNRVFLCRLFFTTMLHEGDAVLVHVHQLKNLA